MDTMRALRAAVADPPTGTAPSPETRAFSTSYPGDYGAFFRAFAGHIETVAPALGVQLEDWGVRFTGEQLARDLPVMQVQAAGARKGEWGRGLSLWRQRGLLGGKV